MITFNAVPAYETAVSTMILAMAPVVCPQAAPTGASPR